MKSSNFLFKSLFYITILTLSLSSYSQARDTNRKTSTAVRVSHRPDIDGTMNDTLWQKAEAAGDFFQYEPHNDRPASQQTLVRVLYDDHAIYISAKLYDSNPDSILTELGLRDADDRLNADQFWVDINPFNDGINGFRFKVSASGVQSDLNLSGGGGDHGDLNWDAVWTSSVNITSEGWTVEMHIPYSALRFPKNEAHEWGINFWREVRRTRETSSWNYVNRSVGDPVAYMGLLTGIKEVAPPLRLSLFPYISSYTQKDGIRSSWSNTFNGGMDLKYGISQNFTIDMTLVPDFGQVQSDARVLNLSPFEVRYDENRQFFTEGTELFSKADLFYSRRIGSTPVGFHLASQLKEENEIVVTNPLETSMINATKFSGRTASGLGIGVFNAMTASSRSTLIDTLTGVTREVVTQPFTNYNLIVLDQSLANNSYISLINTNVAGSAKGYTANVTGTEFRILDKSNMYRISGTAAVSQHYHENDVNNYGLKYDFSIGKHGGTWRYNYNRSVFTDTYDQNDMGYLSRNNQVEDEVSFSHNIFVPFWRIHNMTNSLGIEYQRLYKPDAFTGMEIEYDLRVLFDTRFFISLSAGYQPKGNRDYFEPRVQGRFYETGKGMDFSVSYSTDYRKRVYLDGDIAYQKIISPYDQKAFSMELTPTFRASDRFNISYGLDYQENHNDIGYTGHLDPDSIYFGKRFSPTLINTLGSSYIFSGNISLSFNLRHYWREVVYDGQYYMLETNGGLQPLDQDLQINDINYNAFTIDMLMTWNFAPGSQLTASWKNVIDDRGSMIRQGYFNNLGRIIQEPQVNSFSIKLLYYINYQTLQQLVR